MGDLVVDTDVVSFGFRQTDLFVEHYGPALVGHRSIISFMTVAEILYGMHSRNWGQRKQQFIWKVGRCCEVRGGISFCKSILTFG